MDPLTMMLLFGFGSAALSAFSSGMTNATNESIANQNLASQEKWNQIQFDYNKELQQKLFDRADTAFIQQASQLSKLGINPVGSQLGGTQVGTAIPQSVTAPQKNFQAIAPDFSSLNSMSGMLSALDGFQTNDVNRDVMRQTAKYNAALTQEKELQNLITANKNDIGFDENGMPYLIRNFDSKEQDFNEARYKDESSTANRNKRVDDFQKRTTLNDSIDNYKVTAPIWLKDNLDTAAKDIVDYTYDTGIPRKVLSSVSKVASDTVNTVKDGVNAVKGANKKIADTAKNAGKNAKEKGKNILKKLKSAYDDGMNWITNKIKEW